MVWCHVLLKVMKIHILHSVCFLCFPFPMQNGLVGHHVCVSSPQQWLLDHTASVFNKNCKLVVNGLLSDVFVLWYIKGGHGSSSFFWKCLSCWNSLSLCLSLSLCHSLSLSLSLSPPLPPSLSAPCIYPHSHLSHVWCLNFIYSMCVQACRSLENMYMYN